MEPRFGEDIDDAKRHYVEKMMKQIMDLPKEKQEQYLRLGRILEKSNEELLTRLLDAEFNPMKILEAMRSELLRLLETHPIPSNLPDIREKVQERINAYDAPFLIRLSCRTAVQGVELLSETIESLVQHESHKYN